jgi:5-(carboxyamino)imidazole ribonucleotide mutase
MANGKGQMEQQNPGLKLWKLEFENWGCFVAFRTMTENPQDMQRIKVSPSPFALRPLPCPRVNIAPVNVPERPLVGIIMGSRSDLETMQGAADTLRELDVPFEMRVVSAHRTPDLLFEYASSAESRGLEVIVAGAGGAAHLPGMCAAKTTLPVLGVPVQSKMLSGVDSLLSIVQMPAGIPVGTLAIGRAGAVNAALLAASILGNKYPEIRARVHAYRAAQTAKVLEDGQLE